MRPSGRATDGLGRRAAMAGTAAALATPARAGALTPVALVSSVPTGSSSFELTNALAGGHFAAAGLDVRVVAAATGVATMQQLVAGRCPFARAHVIDVFKAASRQSTPLIVVAGLEHVPSYAVATTAAHPLPIAASLAGKTVGVLGIGSTTDIYLDLVLTAAGVPRDSVRRQVVSGGVAAFAPVRRGWLDAVVLPVEFIDALTKAGEPVASWGIDRYIRIPGRCYLTTRALLDTQPGLVEAFVSGLVASVREIVRGPIDTLIARVTQRFDQSGTLSPDMMGATLENWLADGAANLLRSMPPAWRAARDGLAAAGIATIPDETTLYTNRIVDGLAHG